VPRDHPAESADELPTDCRIATSFPALTKQYFDSIGHTIRIKNVSGACEITPALGIADAIVDLTSSGSTLVMNHMRELATILDSTCRFITGPTVDPAIADEMDRVIFALQSVVDAEGKRYLMADLPRAQLDEVRAFLPGIAGPTVTDVAGDPDTVAIQVVVDKQDIFDAVHRLQSIGGRGIIVLPIERIVS
jgi:ATP phosphoribosyltransferase